MILGGEAVGRYLGHERGSFLNRISPFLEETQELGTVAHTCNPNQQGGKGRKITV
jgi:hypothetical protein